jgi:hypothetical protein
MPSFGVLAAKNWKLRNMCSPLHWRLLTAAFPHSTAELNSPFSFTAFFSVSLKLCMEKKKKKKKTKKKNKSDKVTGDEVERANNISINLIVERPPLWSSGQSS